MALRKLALAILPLLLFATAFAEQPAVSEYQVKAAFLYNFAKFVDWPANAFKESAEPIVVGVLGQDPFGNILEQTLAEKTVHGHPLTVKRFTRLASVERCHILFVAADEATRVPEIRDRLAGIATLTVGETPEFTEAGGMIGFVLEEHRVRFDVNLNAARAAGLNPSSQLLKVARTVLGESQKVSGDVR